MSGPKIYRVEDSAAKRIPILTDDRPTRTPSGYLFHEQLPLDVCQDLVDEMYGMARLREESKPPQVRNGGGGSRARYMIDNHTIALPRWGRVPWVIAHETAHALVHERWPTGVIHGPEFVRIYVRLLSRNVSQQMADEVADEMGVTRCDPDGYPVEQKELA